MAVRAARHDASIAVAATPPAMWACFGIAARAGEHPTAQARVRADRALLEVGSTTVLVPPPTVDLQTPGKAAHEGDATHGCDSDARAALHAGSTVRGVGVAADGVVTGAADEVATGLCPPGAAVFEQPQWPQKLADGSSLALHWAQHEVVDCTTLLPVTDTLSDRARPWFFA